MGRSPCCSKEGLRKGAWSSMEDQILSNYVLSHGEGNWHLLPIKAGLKRCGKSCRLRWRNYLRPDIKRGGISKDEEDLIIRLHSLLGNRWSLIAGRLPGRTDNEIKNYWNTKFARRSRCDQKSPSKSVQMISKGQKSETPKHSRKSKDHPQPIQSKAIQCNVATKMLEFEEEHDLLVDLRVRDNDIFFNKDQIHRLNPNIDHQSLVPDEDGALNMDHAHHDHSRYESTPPSLNPSTGIIGVDGVVGSGFEWDYETMSCEKHVEFDLMQELKRVASLLDLEDEGIACDMRLKIL